MPLLKEYRSKEAFIGLWEISEDLPTLQILAKESHLPIDDTEGIKNRQRIAEIIATRLLLHCFFGYYPSLEHTEQGKPFFKNEPYFISISHTKGYAAIYLHTQNEIGIDIEYRSTRVKKVAHRFLHPNEQKFISTKDPMEHLLVCWSAKETVFKQMNKTNIEFAQDIIISPFELEQEGDIEVTDCRERPPKKLTISYQQKEKFIWTHTVLIR